jgi:hypothetical protein
MAQSVTGKCTDTFKSECKVYSEFRNLYKGVKLVPDINRRQNIGGGEKKGIQFTHSKII